MSIVESMLMWKMHRGNDRFIPKEEDSFPDLINFIKKTSEYLKITTGELDPSVYERPEIIGLFSSLLEKKVTISIVFNKADTEGQMKTLLEKENYNLFLLKQKYPDNLILFYSPVRLQSHYAVCDDKHTFIEGEHPPKQRRDVIVRYNNPTYAESWSKSFNELVGLPKIKKVD